MFFFLAQMCLLSDAPPHRRQSSQSGCALPRCFALSRLPIFVHVSLFKGPALRCLAPLLLLLLRFDPGLFPLGCAALILLFSLYRASPFNADFPSTIQGLRSAMWGFPGASWRPAKASGGPPKGCEDSTEEKTRLSKAAQSSPEPCFIIWT